VLAEGAATGLGCRTVQKFSAADTGSVPTDHLCCIRTVAQRPRYWSRTLWTSQIEGNLFQLYVRL